MGPRLAYLMRLSMCHKFSNWTCNICKRMVPGTKHDFPVNLITVHVASERVVQR